MKIIIGNSIVKEAENSINNVVNTYREDIPMCKDLLTNMDITPEETTGKWGSITRDTNSLIIEINDELIYDIIKVYEKLINKFSPIMNVAFSMIPMIKNYFKDAVDIVNPLVEKYTERDEDYNTVEGEDTTDEN